MVPTPTSTPTVGPGPAGRRRWPSSTQKQANQVPAVRLMAASRMNPSDRRASTSPNPAYLRQNGGLAVHLHSVRPVVRANMLRHLSGRHRFRQHLNNVRGPDAAPSPDGQTLAGVLVIWRTPRRFRAPSTGCSAIGGETVSAPPSRQSSGSTSPSAPGRSVFL